MFRQVPLCVTSQQEVTVLSISSTVKHYSLTPTTTFLGTKKREDTNTQRAELMRLYPGRMRLKFLIVRKVRPPCAGWWGREPATAHNSRLNTKMGRLRLTFKQHRVFVGSREAIHADFSVGPAAKIYIH